MLYVDIPTTSDLLALTEHRDTAAISLYLPTTPVTANGQGSRIELKSLARNALRELEQRNTDSAQVSAIEELVHSLVDDEEFWRYQAHSLAVFATPERIRHFRLPNRLERQATVSDRFQIEQLLRAVTFPNAGYVLVIAEGGVRLVEVSPEIPACTVPLPALPSTVKEFETEPLADRLPMKGPRGSTGDMSAQRQFARKVNGAVRDYLRGSGLPLVLAATEPMASIYRSVNTYPRLTEAVIAGSPDVLTDSVAAERARPVFDATYRDELAAWCETFDRRENQGRATTDVAQAARAATAGAIDSMLIDMTARLYGTVDETDGTLRFADAPGPDAYSVLGEISARVIRSSGRVLAVRTDDLPNRSPLAAILRYPV